MGPERDHTFLPKPVFYVTITYCRLGHYYVTFNLCNINFCNRLKSKAVVIKTAF